MAESPTAWWCPACKAVLDPTYLDEHTDENVKPIQVPVLPPGLSLADLAVRLRDAGYEVDPGWLSENHETWWVREQMVADEHYDPVLVVAAKEPAA